MRLQYHTAFSFITAGMLLIFFKSWSMATASIITGILIDLDHIPDYVREHGWNFNIRNFFHACHCCKFKKIMLIWHGWEWLLLLALSAWASGWNPWMAGALIGLTHHMILDAVHISPSFRSYSLLWRWKNGFDFNKAFGKRVPFLLKRC